MKKYAIGLLLFAIFMLASISIGVVYAAFESVPEVGPGHCVPMPGYPCGGGSSSGSGSSSSSGSTGSGAVDKGGYRTTYGQGDERTQETEEPTMPSLEGGTPVDAAGINTQDYSSMSYDELVAESERLNAEWQTIWDEEEACEAPVEATWQNCINTCNYAEYDCRCYENWVVPWEACWDAFDAKNAPITAAQDAVWAAMEAAYARGDYGGGSGSDESEYDTGGESGGSSGGGGGGYSSGSGTGGGTSGGTGTGGTGGSGKTPTIYDISDEDSAQLMEAVVNANKQSRGEVQEYYSKPTFIDPTIKTDKEAAINFDDMRPQVVDLINARGDYRDAINNGASGAELNQLQTNYEGKMQDIKNNLQTNVLDKDAGNPDALWQMGTISKWEGNNVEAYEYYRDSLSSEKARNPIRYQQMLDSINDPAWRMQLLQDLEPGEKIITIPIPDISPYLNALKNNLKQMVQPLSDKVQEAAQQVEQLSRAFSFSDRASDMMKELGVVEKGGDEQ